MKMSKPYKTGWFAAGLFILTAGILSISCGGPAATPSGQASPTGFTIVTASAISHPLANFEDCTKCHVAGQGSVPAGHTSFTNANCQSCHKPGTTETK